MRIAQVVPLDESVPPRLTIDDAVAAIKRPGSLDRRQVRRRFEERFNASRMVDDYEAIYASAAADIYEPKDVPRNVAIAGRSNPHSEIAP
ncbi:hypothetical protein [Mesorhizobium sp.]|uniref:hypothetical protein n=1 Tax=Mesorhizobium sp. TaxID=1871066 RepID=UPI001208ABBB|nr:hypothetical protein [Mesorhizobium sp.]TIS96866.1 MAG: glycosyltransferase family 4 protein [Mesorhizobium sp.]